MSIKLLLKFEIGHRAAQKTKPSKEGFTHDWELFVQGEGGNYDISQFVEKVIFNLHESFPKPKRTFKEPPYVVKEAGYAGFLLTIDIYLKNRDEPKKITFDYDLDLQPFKIQMNELVVAAPSEDFRRKCMKGGAVIINSSNDYKNRDAYGKSAPMPSVIDLKKPPKRPEENKPSKTFTDLFGSPLKKPDPRTLHNASPNPTKLPSNSKVIDKPSSVTSGSKDKGEKLKHKHSPNKDGKDSKKVNEGQKPDVEKPKKDKTKDRERGEKKEKTSKRLPSPPPVSMPTSTSAARNSTNPSSLPASKNDLIKPPAKLSSTPMPTVDPAFNKKSSKKDKKSDKERERNEKKDARAKEPPKDKLLFDSPSSKGSSSGMKERDLNATKDDRDKGKRKPNVPSTEPKTTPAEVVKKPHDKDSERKHKHKKKEKTKDKEVKDNKKEKQHKNSIATPSPAKTKEPPVKYEPPSDSDESPPSIPQESDNSVSQDTIMQKPPPEAEKVPKKPRERTKAADKEEKSRKRKANKKDERESSLSPPPSKQQKKDVSKSPDRQSSSDSAANQSHMNNNNVDGAGSKISNDYMSELKELKQKITTLKNNDELQQVVRMIAATGCYEITKSSFDFDLVQLDRQTVQRLREFFATQS